jgi:hypothetical protein
MSTPQLVITVIAVAIVAAIALKVSRDSARR